MNTVPEIVTAIFNDYDPIRPLPRGITGICFTDTTNSADGWELHQLCTKQFSARLQNRYVKTQLFQLLNYPDITLYIDGSFEIIDDPRPWAVEVLGDSDIAAYAHPQRNCVYEEARVCIRQGRGNPKSITQQIERYRASGLPAASGLYGGGILIRRRTNRMISFGEAWWKEIKCGSERDQLSLGFLSWKLGIKIRVILGNYYKPPFALHRGHRK